MFGDGHEFYVRESQITEILSQRMRKLAVVQERAVLAAPRTQMGLVDRHGRLEAVAGGARAHPPPALPFVVESPRTRRRGRRRFAIEADGIGLLENTTPVAGHDP